MRTITKAEEKIINNVYANQIKICRRKHSRIKPRSEYTNRFLKWAEKLFFRGLFYLYCVLVPILIITHLFFGGNINIFPYSVIFIILFAIFVIGSFLTWYGSGILFLIGWCLIKVNRSVGYYFNYKEFWEYEKILLLNHLNNLHIKTELYEPDIINYLNLFSGSYDLNLLGKNEKKIKDIYGNIINRINNVKTEKEKKRMRQTPWDFFRRHFFHYYIIKKYPFLVTNEKQYVSFNKISKIKKMIDEIYLFFFEFDRAPRIPGDLVLEFEKVLDKYENLLPIKKNKIINFVEEWRITKREMTYAEIYPKNLRIFYKKTNLLKLQNI